MLVGLVEFTLIIALNGIIGDLLGGFSAWQALGLLIAELAGLTYANRRVRQRLRTS